MWVRIAPRLDPCADARDHDRRRGRWCPVLDGMRVVGAITPRMIPLPGSIRFLVRILARMNAWLAISPPG